MFKFGVHFNPRYIFDAETATGVINNKECIPISECIFFLINGIPKYLEMFNYIFMFPHIIR